MLEKLFGGGKKLPKEMEKKIGRRQKLLGLKSQLSHVSECGVMVPLVISPVETEKESD